jgi:hypothetical protein
MPLRAQKYSQVIHPSPWNDPADGAHT